MTQETTWGSFPELQDDYIQLIPLEQQHQDALLQAVGDGNLWELWYTSVPSAATISAYMQKALTEQQEGKAQAFAVVLRATNTIIGSTRYCNMDRANLRLEIGFTWYAATHQRTSVNTRCKYLLLQHAFESMQCNAVEFRTNWHNHTSRAAILRLGAKQDGVLRNHRLLADGSICDTVVFSITKEEWPAVKCSLLHHKERPKV